MNKTIILDADTDSIRYLCKKDRRLAKVIETIGPLSYEVHTNGYSFLIHEIIEQMLSIKAGAKIFSRLSDLCNGNVTVDSISQLTDEEIRSTGTSSNKTSYIRALTYSITSNELILSDLEIMSDEDVIKKLTRVKGIGKWTAKMYLIFVLNRQNILPIEDVAFLQSYKWLYNTEDLTNAAISKKCKKWTPYSSIAARYLYRALDTGLTKSKFHLYAKTTLSD